MKEIKKIKAVYGIKNKETGMVYIGGSFDVKSRFNAHRQSLKRGAHVNLYLQRDYDIYGKGAFEYFVIERVTGERSLLVEREQHWMDTHKSKYNICPRADGSVVAEETRRKISKTQKRNSKFGIGKGSTYNRRHPNRLTPEIVVKIRNIREVQGLSYKKIGDIFGINHSRIGSIIRNESWKNMEDPIEDIMAAIPATKTIRANKEQQQNITNLFKHVDKRSQ